METADVLLGDVTKLRLVRRRASLDDTYNTTATLYTTARPSLDRPARPFLKGTTQWRQRELKVGGDEPCEPTVRLPD